MHSVWHEDSVLTGGVWDTFLLVPPLLDRPVEKMLIIGNAGGTVARAYGELYPDVGDRRRRDRPRGQRGGQARGSASTTTRT